MLPLKFSAAFICAAALITGMAGANLHAAVIHVPYNYKNIQDAVSNSQPADTIIVHKGDYKDNIIVEKSITIRSSEGFDTAAVKALNPSNPVFRISNASGVIISGLTITGSGMSGIYLQNSHNTAISDNRIVKNESGILLYSSNNNTISNNIVKSNEQYGIYLESSNNNTLKGNTADSNKDKGIFLSLSNHNNLANNSASLNTWNGIILWASHNNTLKENSILRNTYGLVISDSEETTLIDNTVWSNIYIILPAILVYIGIIFFFIQKRIFSFIYSEK
ncbi:MAG: NosD domain-containing protein [Nitrospirota bacterium]|jgi:parallel beta-helix repeat protein